MTHNGNTCSQLLLGDRVVAVHDVREEIHADAEVVEAGLAEREELVAAVLREPAGGARVNLARAPIIFRARALTSARSST